MNSEEDELILSILSDILGVSTISTLGVILLSDSADEFMLSMSLRELALILLANF
jgi:hypothetical protein